MSRDRLTAAIAYLMRFYPRQTVTPSLVDGYVAELSDLPVEDVEAAVRSAVRTSPYWPTVAELRDTAVSLRLGLPSEPDALAAVEAYLAALASRRLAPCSACAGSGVYDDGLTIPDMVEGECPACSGEGKVYDRPLPVLHDLVRRSLQLVGGSHAWKAADKPAVVRGQFLSIFRELRASALREARTGDVRGPLALPGSDRKAIEQGGSE